MKPSCVLITALLAASANAFSVCSGVTDRMAMKKIDLTPDKPVPGESLSVSFDATPDENILGGSITVEVQVFGVTIATKAFDVCKDAGLTCPLAKNVAVTGTIKYPIPSAAPSGITATAKITMKDSASTELSCIDVDITMGSKSSSVLLGATPVTVVSLRGTAAPAGRFDDATKEFMFEAWRRQFGKTFESAAAYMRRLAIFGANLRKIADHNDAGTPGDASDDPSWTMGLNQFGHLTSAEFKATYTGGFKASPADEGTTAAPTLKSTLAAPELADAIDWVAKGAVTSVKNQGTCGSCWTFSTAGSMEGAYQIKTGTLKNFSEEQLLACDKGGDACGGGSMPQAFEWLESNGGICALDSYPYKEIASPETKTKIKCKSTCTVVPDTKVSGYVNVDTTEAAMAAAVSKGPVSVAIEADQDAFHFYTGGVMSGKCGTELDHGVLVVGYGTDGGKEYWKIKNSWDTTWGEDGYIRIAKGLSQTGGQCGVLQMASYPTLA